MPCMWLCTVNLALLPLYLQWALNLAVGQGLDRANYREFNYPFGPFAFAGKLERDMGASLGSQNTSQN